MSNTGTGGAADGGNDLSTKRRDSYPSPADMPVNLGDGLRESDDKELLEDNLTARIRSAICYAASIQGQRQMPVLYSDFTVRNEDTNSTARRLLENAESANIATAISESHTHVRYSLSVEPVKREKAFNYAVRDPQWWRGMTKAEIRAGPDTDMEKIKQAERYVKEREKKERCGARKKWFEAERHNIRVALKQQGWSEERLARLEGKGKKRHEGGESLA